MTPFADLALCNTIAEVKQVRRKYIDYMPDYLKWKFENWIQHSMRRISRIEREKCQAENQE
jgi:hypothetical protein